ncbi:hypothetical protein [Acanthopleuribacter pedis]|uniref:Uncharacterized protein n=1 Tax=Acanthopleuribacter pedis TaxID=442870 RepID=A0A8J7QG94_9BACT|nr:hypothetical protein [Acanthopleuribacter pedis]MBO1317980.1 hypothetical protein [Acanthopleuribacter pedis]
MKRVSLFLLALLGCQVMGTELFLRPKPNLAGHDPRAREIRIHELSGNGEFWIQVMVANNTEPISAAQVEIVYPANWVLVEGPRVQGTAPLRRGADLSTEVVAFLPSNQDGVYQDTLIDNARGHWRAMMVIGDFQSHLSPSVDPQVLFEMRFRAVGLSQAPCSSANGLISLRPTAMDPQYGSMVLNHRAEMVAVDWQRNQAIQLIHEGAMHKGNLTRYLPGGSDQSLNYDDLAVLLRCMATNQRGCGLVALSVAEYEQLTDIDCSGGDPNWSDIQSLRVLIERSAMTAKTKKGEALVLKSEQGSFRLSLAGYPNGLVIEAPRDTQNIEPFLAAVDALPKWHAVVLDQPNMAMLVVFTPQPGEGDLPDQLTWTAESTRVQPFTLTPLHTDLSLSEQE